MKIISPYNTLYIFLIFSTTLSTVCMDTPKTNWLNAVADIILGNAPAPTSPASSPQEIPKSIISLLAAFRNATNLKSAANIINALAEESKELEQLLNQTAFTFKLITYLSDRFHIDNETVCKYLQIKEAKRILGLQTLIQDLCKQGIHLNYFKGIYTQGINPDFTYKHGLTLLLFCIQNNALIIMRFLLKKGANPDFFTPGTATPLTMSILEDKEQMVESLLEFGANPLQKDGTKLSPQDATNFMQNTKIKNLLSRAIRKRKIVN